VPDMMRRFTTLVLALTAACASAPRAATTAAADDDGFDLAGDYKGPLGVQLYTFRGAFRGGDVPGTLARVRSLGFREVETAGMYGLSPQRFKEELDRAGLRAVSMHAGYEFFRDSLPVVVAQAKAVGARFVGVAWIPHPNGPMTVERARQAAADFNRWGQALRAEGLTFFYHIHGYEFVPDASGTVPMDVLMRETDANNVSFELDTFWAAHPGQDPAALLRKYPGRWKLMHLKDMKKGVVTPVHTGGAPPDESEVPVGSGQIDFRAVLKAAREAGIQHYFVEDETRDPFATVPVTTKWLESVKF